jgi:protease secretion system outer membrane protein
LNALISNGSEALRIQREAIFFAELSVEANRQSYQGGVRTAVDVINAIQTLFQMKTDYVSLATTQAENILGINLLTTIDTNLAITATEQFLFANLRNNLSKNN